MVVVELRKLGANGKAYLLHPLSHAELNRLRWLTHRLHCTQGLSVRQVQRELAEQHGIRRSIGVIHRDLTWFSCGDCRPGPGDG